MSKNIQERFHIVSRLAKVHIDAQEVEHSRSYLRRIKEEKSAQQEFYHYCHQWKMAPWVYLQLLKNELAEALHEEVLREFQTAYKKVYQQNEQRNAEARRFFKQFVDHGIDAVVLKGNLLAHTVYHDIGYKRMNDFDLLIKRDDWIKVQEIYESLDYLPLGFGWAGEKQKPAKYSHVSTPFVSRNFHCIIGTQWGLKSPTTRYEVDIEQAWDSSLPFDFYDLPLRQLTPEYNLLHLILHMGLYKCGIRDCMDVFNLWSTSSMDQQRLLDLFQRTKAIDKANFTLQLSQQCSGVFEADFLQELNDRAHPRSFVSLRLTARKEMIDREGDMHHSYNDYFQDVEKSVIYFNLFHQFHKKLFFYGKMMRLIFFPDREHRLKFMDRLNAKNSVFQRLIARLKAPYYVFSVLAEEIGWKYTILLFFKLLFDLIASVRFYLIPQKSYFDFLKQKGIEAANIKKLVRNVQ